jgi:hypothetical protein
MVQDVPEAASPLPVAADAKIIGVASASVIFHAASIFVTLRRNIFLPSRVQALVSVVDGSRGHALISNGGQFATAWIRR